MKMLTVKLVEHDGHEQIYEAQHVWVETQAREDGGKTVCAETESHGLKKFSDYGDIYVMNDKGQTVAKYFLGYGPPSNTPLPGDAPPSAP